jgi:hypothetical protein
MLRLKNKSKQKEMKYLLHLKIKVYGMWNLPHAVDNKGFV